jgi:kinesin family protein 18/19
MSSHRFSDRVLKFDSTKCDDGTLFLGEGSLAGAPPPKLGQKGIRSIIRVIDEKCLVFDPPEDNPVTRFSRSVVSNMGKRVKDQTFGFDRVFDDNTTQAEVYESTARGLLDSVMDGYNATVFAYGATGCGKTHTITGTAQQPGIIFLTMQELFEKIAERSDEKQTEVSLSYLEIYNETIRDLLVPGGSKQGLMLREDANQAVSVAGLSSHHPKDVQEVMDMIVKGNEYRTVSPTEANATSSRSHAVIQINVAQKDRNADVNEPHTMATLSIIDLAGSERASATKNRGDRLLEGANINKSLLALGSCINALCDPRKKNHVPYRNSKLTRLLKFSLGGNCKTVMIVCISPSSVHFDETQNTLRYANRAKNIQTKVTRNVFNVNRHVKDFLVKIDEQMALINELKAQQKDSEALAFVKFRKLTEKRDGIAREGVIRIRAAFDNSAGERQEKVSSMKKLRQIERRIRILNLWVSGFDDVCGSREDEEMPPSLIAMRKTACGILAELENSRHHYHQKIAKMNWERAVDSALQNSIRMLTEVDGTSDGLDVASLTREAELLKANAGRDSLLEVLEMEKNVDLDDMKVLLTAQMDIVSSLNDILGMNEKDAVSHAKGVLGNLLQTCSAAAGQIVKPDGSMKIVESFPPSKRGTPKKKKPAHVPEPQARPIPVMPVLAAAPPPADASPMKASPRRRKAGLGKKGISFTPVKRSTSKRSVRWRDDTDSGALAEFEKTPQKPVDSPAPDESSIDQSVVLPTLPTYLADDTFNDSIGSSPIPAVPQPTLDIKPRSNRFQAGFLKKKTDGSPPPPTITSLSSSDNENSPLRTINAERATNSSSLNIMKSSARSTSPSDSANNSSSESEGWKVDRSESAKISKALRRSGSISRASNDSSRHRRARSPTAATMSGSPPNENNLFTASHARRMVKSDKESTFQTSVLSPRTQPIMKANRRTTISESRQVSGSMGSGAIRLTGTIGSTPKTRESVANLVGKGSWR